jgi:uncharacterized protein (UPF0332 family)
MKSNIKKLIENGFATKDDSVKNLAFKYLGKARINLITMSLLYDLSLNRKAKSILAIPRDYKPDEWIVICGYYAMYSSALALLARIGFRSKNHSATIQILDEYFVKNNILDKNSFLLLKNAVFHKEELEKLSEAKHKREIAQYSVTRKTTRDIAEKIKKDAREKKDKC